MTIDLRLYAVLDPDRLGGLDLATLAARVVQGGATIVQLRDKHASTRRLVEETRELKSVLRHSTIPLLVNDRVDVALAGGAQGVHLGQDDLAIEDARQLLGPNAVIGLSVKSVAQAQAAPLEVLDYVCVGGVFATSSKDNPDPPVGVAGLKEILTVLRHRRPQLPIGAIAGIDAGNAADVIGAGADGVAVISALSLASDPAKAASELRAIVDDALTRRATS